MNMIDPLPSWNSGAVKEAITNFVENIATQYEPEDRIVTLDNDGTLWSERPRYFQEYFISPALIEKDKNPDQKPTPLTKLELLQKDREHHVGISTAKYIELAQTFLKENKHPTLDRLFTALTYQPLIELLAYLRHHQFQIYICSGGGRDFVRALSPKAYEIPPENVIGSSTVTKFEEKTGEVVRRIKVVDTIDTSQSDKGLGQYNDKEGKPVGIQRQIGKRPIMAVGNSTGDLQMFHYTDQGKDKSLIVLLNHDDAEREFKYNDDPTGTHNEINPITGEITAENVPDNESLIEADESGNPHWIVVSMKDDFNTMFTSDPKPL